jgi:opacity protein-like surface antigen
MKVTKHLLSIDGLLLIIPPATLGQTRDYHRWEFFGGYSAMKFDTLAGDTGNATVDDVLGGRNTLRGLDLATTYNFHKYIGATFDYSAHWRNDNFSRPAGSGTVHSNVQNVLGGLTFKNNLDTGPVFKPFAHALFGFAHQRVNVDSPQLPALFGSTEFRTSESSFAMAFGGGVDLRVNHRIAVRAVQIDWNIIDRGAQQTGIVLVATPHQTVGTPFVIPGTRQDNLRLGAGIVIH